jgi:hypothetical protein
MKKCTKCNIERPLTDFRQRKLAGDKIGYRGECIDCSKSQMKKNYEIRQQELNLNGPIVITKKCCPKCNIEKPSNDFIKNKARKDGVSVYCKSCTKEYSSTPKRKEYDKKRNEKRKTQENYIQYHIEYRKNNMDKQVKRNFDLYHSNPLEKLKQNFRNRIRKYIDRKSVPSNSIIGCSWEMFKDHIENQFQTGMTWDNHTQFGWHLDHIIPLASANTEEDLYRLNHYTNFQPLWWRDNLSKSDKIIENTNNKSIPRFTES